MKSNDAKKISFVKLGYSLISGMGINELVLINVCHFHHLHLRVVQIVHFLSKVFRQIKVLHSIEGS